MSKCTTIAASGAMVITLGGCIQDPNNLPLVFGQAHTVGISVAAPASGTQGIDFTLGYKDANFAVVPATVRQANGDSTQIRSKVENSDNALSVLGQFEAKVDASTSVKSNLGKFFATGLAADKLADGFADQLGKPPTNAATTTGTKLQENVSQASTGQNKTLAPLLQGSFDETGLHVQLNQSFANAGKKPGEKQDSAK